VTVLAVLAFLSTCACFLWGAVYVNEGLWFHNYIPVTLGIIFTIVALAYLVAGLGLLKGKNWARIIYLILSLLTIVYIIPLIYIWYLTRSRVREFFGKP
jgi:hypothetical protein